MALVVGRLVEVTAPETVSIPVNSKGYLAIVVDLSKSNIATGSLSTNDYTADIKQVSIKFVTSLTQQPISNSGLTYMFNLGTVTSDTASATFVKATDSASAISLVNNFVVEQQRAAKRNIPIGYGVTGTLYRTGNIVRLEINSNQTESRGNGSQKLGETIPLGYVPRISTQGEAVMMIGPNFRGTSKLMFNFISTGEIYVYSESMNASPINVVMSVQWISQDPFPTSDIL